MNFSAVVVKIIDVCAYSIPKYWLNRFSEYDIMAKVLRLMFVAAVLFGISSVSRFVFHSVKSVSSGAFVALVNRG